LDPGQIRGDAHACQAIVTDVDEIEVVVAHSERATLRVGDVFLKVDADQRRSDVEVAAMALAPIPTPDVLWREPARASSAAWAAAGAAVRTLHDAPLPPWPGLSPDEIATQLDDECARLVTDQVLPADLVRR